MAMGDNRLVLLATVSLTIVIALAGGARGSRRCPSSRILPHTTRIVPYNEKCYQFVHIETYWTPARDYCRRYGGRLLTIPDAATNAFIIGTLNSLPWRNRGVWTGLHDTTEEMAWEWSTESSAVAQLVTFTNWGRGHPQGIFHSYRDCVRMVRGSGTWKWHETPCAALAWKYRSICQYDMIPTTSTSMTTTTTRPTTTTRRITTTSRPTTTRRPSTTTTTTAAPPTTVVQFGVGLNVNRIGPGDDMRKDDSVTSAAGGVTTAEELIMDVVIPLRLEQNEDDNQNSMLQVVIVVSLVAVALALIVIIAVYFRRRRQEKVAEDTVTIANPLYAKTGAVLAGNRIVVRIDGQTAVLKGGQPENVYTDEPTNNESASTAEDGTNLAGNYQDMNYASPTDQNALNAETESGANINPTSHTEAVSLRNKARPVPATPTGEYLAMNGGRLAGIGQPSPGYTGYEEPVCHHRVSNIYAEIPDQEGVDPLAENFYESLDEIEKDFHQRFSHA